MKNVAIPFSICLAVTLGGLAPLHAECKVASTGISAVTGGYTVALPPSVSSAVPTNAPLRLVLRGGQAYCLPGNGPGGFDCVCL